MKQLYYVILILLIISCNKSDNDRIPVTSNSDQAKNLYERAKYFENIHQLDSANVLLNQAIQMDTTFAMAYLMKGMISENFEDRTNYINKAFSNIANTFNGEQLWISGRNTFYGSTEDNISEIDYYKDLVFLYPKDPYANYLFGFINHHHGNLNLDIAIKHLEEAIQIKPDFTAALNDLTYAYIEKKDFSNARRTSSLLIELLPNQPGPYDTHAEILMREGNYKESIKTYEKILEIDSTTTWSYIGIAANLNYLDEHYKARQILRILDGFDEINDYDFRHKWKAEAVSYLDEGNIDSALVVLNDQKIMGLEKKNSHEPLFHAYIAYSRMTRLYFEKGNWEMGLNEYENWLEFAEENLTNVNAVNSLKKQKLYYESYSLYIQEEYTQALNLLDSYLKEIKDENEQYLILKARIYHSQKNSNEAIETIKKCDLNNAYNQFLYGLMLISINETSQANLWFEKIKNANLIDNIDLALVRNQIN